MRSSSEWSSRVAALHLRGLRNLERAHGGQHLYLALNARFLPLERAQTPVDVADFPVDAIGIAALTVALAAPSPPSGIWWLVLIAHLRKS